MIVEIPLFHLIIIPASKTPMLPATKLVRFCSKGRNVALLQNGLVRPFFFEAES